MHQLPKHKYFSSHLAVVFAQSIEATCWVTNEDVVGAAPTGDAPTTPEWSTVLFLTKVRIILEIWWYVLKAPLQWVRRQTTLQSSSHDFLLLNPHRIACFRELKPIGGQADIHYNGSIVSVKPAKVSIVFSMMMLRSLVAFEITQSRWVGGDFGYEWWWDWGISLTVVWMPCGVTKLESALVQVMTCHRFSAKPSPELVHIFVSRTVRNKLQWNLNKNTKYSFEKMLRKMIAILFGP